MTTELVSASFLSRIRAIFPSSRPTSSSAWYIIASVGFSASNRPEAIPLIFEHALLDAHTHQERLLRAQKMREALFKSGLTAGYSKVINALVELNKVCPEDLKETKVQRDTSRSLASYENDGDRLFSSIYGQTAPAVQSLLDSAYPDMGYFSKTIGYGFVYSFSSPTHLSNLETSFVLVTALIAADTPKQIKWHLDGARRNGATDEEVRAVREMGISVADQAGAQRRNEVPEV